MLKGVIAFIVGQFDLRTTSHTCLGLLASQMEVCKNCTQHNAYLSMNSALRPHRALRHLIVGDTRTLAGTVGPANQECIGLIRDSGP